MREVILRLFFEGHATAEELARDVAGAAHRQTVAGGPTVSHVHIQDMAAEFSVESQHVLQLLDAVEAGALDLEALDAICFCLEASDHFTWDTDTTDGERVAESLFLLGTPEVNYPLTPIVLAKVRHYLRSGQHTFTREDLRPDGPRPYLLSVTQKSPGHGV
jgi:hypothetical protein